MYAIIYSHALYYVFVYSSCSCWCHTIRQPFVIWGFAVLLSNYASLILSNSLYIIIICHSPYSFTHSWFPLFLVTLCAFIPHVFSLFLVRALITFPEPVTEKQGISLRYLRHLLPDNDFACHFFLFALLICFNLSIVFWFRVCLSPMYLCLRFSRFVLDCLTILLVSRFGLSASRITWLTAFDLINYYWVFYRGLHLGHWKHDHSMFWPQWTQLTLVWQWSNRGRCWCVINPNLDVLTQHLQSLTFGHDHGSPSSCSDQCSPATHSSASFQHETRTGTEAATSTCREVCGRTWGVPSLLTQCRLIMQLQPLIFPTESFQIAHLGRWGRMPCGRPECHAAGVLTGSQRRWSGCLTNPSMVTMRKNSPTTSQNLNLHHTYILVIFGKAFFFLCQTHLECWLPKNSRYLCLWWNDRKGFCLACLPNYLLGWSWHQMEILETPKCYFPL